MLSNRTHHLQEQLTTSIIDTGVDLKQLDHNQEHRVINTQNSIKKLSSFKDDSTDHESLSKLRRHKKIQKTTKKGEKFKGKAVKSGTSKGKSENYYLQESNFSSKNISVSHEKDCLMPVINQQTKNEKNQIQKKQYLFPLCVNKANNNFYGYFGHSTIIINEPIIQGAYYVQVEILNPSHPNHPKGKQFESSVRIGLCKNNHHLLVPLGGQNSYCYKSKDGSLLHSGNKVQQIIGQSYGPGDTIGVYLYMSPPYRNMRENNIHNIPNLGSKLIFFKNGKVCCQLNNLNQCFYNIGISLFNWANINVNVGPDFKHKVQLQHKAVGRLFQQNTAYSDIKLC